MIIVSNKYNNIDQLLRSYKRETDKTNLLKNFKARLRFEKPSTTRRKMINTAIKTQKYKEEHNLI
ncbi:MAG: 30S ribosomal protein S21 [Bacteroidota bacterium]